MSHEHRVVRYGNPKDYGPDQTKMAEFGWYPILTAGGNAVAVEGEYSDACGWRKGTMVVQGPITVTYARRLDDPRRGWIGGPPTEAERRNLMEWLMETTRRR